MANFFSVGMPLSLKIHAFSTEDHEASSREISNIQLDVPRAGRTSRLPNKRRG